MIRNINLSKSEVSICDEIDMLLVRKKSPRNPIREGIRKSHWREILEILLECPFMGF